MAVPKRKTSPSRRGMRRSADALKQPTYVEDKDSGELRRPHHLDLKTGMYKGRQVLKKCTEAPRPEASGAKRRAGLSSRRHACILIGFPLLLHPVRDLQHDRVPDARSELGPTRRRPSG